MRNKIIKIVFIIFILVSLNGCTFTERFYTDVTNKEKIDIEEEDDDGSPYKVFDKGDFKITLPSDYKEFDIVIYTYYFENNKGEVVSVIKDTKSELGILGLNENSTISEYLEIVQKLNRTEEKYTKVDNYYFLEYTDDDFYYSRYVFDTGSTFWSIDMSCDVNNNSNCMNELHKLIKEIEIENLYL